MISLERPIKPGDYVRVGEFQGTVERIGARSTEIVTSDRHDLRLRSPELAHLVAALAQRHFSTEELEAARAALAAAASAEAIADDTLAGEQKRTWNDAALDELVGRMRAADGVAIVVPDTVTAPWLGGRRWGGHRTGHRIDP